MITIITPTLNPGQQIKRLLDSVALQTVPCEHLIVDGGSTDGTRELVAQYPHATWIDAPGTSIYEAQNVGIMAATGKWAYFIGADDTIALPDTLRRVALTGEKSDARVVRGMVQFVTESGRISGQPTFATRQQAFLYDRTLYSEFGAYDAAHTIYADVVFQKLVESAGVKQCRFVGAIAIVQLGGFSSVNGGVN